MVDDPPRVAELDSHTARPPECLDEATAFERSLERAQPIACRGRLLEALLTREHPHPFGEPLADHRRVAREAPPGVVDGALVFGGLHRTRAGAVRHTELGGAARAGVGRRGERPAEPCGATSEWDRGLDRFDDQPCHGPRRERTEVETGSGRILHDRQARPRRVDVEADVAVLLDALAGPVVAGKDRGDEATLDHLGGEGVGQVEVADRLGLTQHRADLAPVVAAEIATDALAQVGGLADVEHLVAVPAEHVDAGGPGEIGGHLEFRRLRVTRQFGQREEVVEAEHPEPGRPFDEEVEQIGGGEGVVEGTMARLVIEPEP